MATRISPWSPLVRGDSPVMTYDAFVTIVDKYHQYHPYDRYGQAVMNVLYSIHPNLYNRLCANHLDIFHATDQSSIESALDWIRRELSPHK